MHSRAVHRLGTAQVPMSGRMLIFRQHRFGLKTNFMAEAHVLSASNSLLTLSNPFYVPSQSLCLRFVLLETDRSVLNLCYMLLVPNMYS